MNQIVTVFMCFSHTVTPIKGMSLPLCVCLYVDGRITQIRGRISMKFVGGVGCVTCNICLDLGGKKKYF